MIPDTPSRVHRSEPSPAPLPQVGRCRLLASAVVAGLLFSSPALAGTLGGLGFGAGATIEAALWSFLAGAAVIAALAVAVLITVEVRHQRAMHGPSPWIVDEVEDEIEARRSGEPWRGTPAEYAEELLRRLRDR